MATLVHVVSSIVAILAIASSTLKSVSCAQALELISGLPHALVGLFGTVVRFLGLVLLLLKAIIVGPQRVLLELILKVLLIHVCLILLKALIVRLAIHDRKDEE